MLKTFQDWASTTPDVLSSVMKLKPLCRGPILLKKSEPSLRGKGINTQTVFFSKKYFQVIECQLHQLKKEEGEQEDQSSGSLVGGCVFTTTPTPQQLACSTLTHVQQLSEGVWGGEDCQLPTNSLVWCRQFLRLLLY